MWQQLKQIAKGSAIYGLGNVANSVLGFLLVPLYTHHLSTSEFGAYSLLITGFGLLSIVIDAGLTNSVGRYYFDGSPQETAAELEIRRSRLISSALLLSALIAAAVAGATILGADLGARLLFPGESRAGLAQQAANLRILGVALFFRGLTVAPQVYLRVTEQPVAYSILTSGQLVIFLVLNIVLLTSTGLGIAGLFYSLLLSQTLYAVGLLWAIRRDLRWCLDKDLSRELLRFGLPFLPVLLNMWIIDLSDRYLLGLYLSTSVVGIYSLGYKFGQAMQLVVTAFSMGWVPVRFKVLNLDEPQAIYSRVATFYLATAGMAWVGLTAYAPEIVRLTSTPSYFGAAQFVGPVGFAYLINGLFVIAVTGLGIAKNASKIPLVSLGAVILNIALNLLLIPHLGAMAAAYATIVAYGFLAAGSLHYSQKLYPIAYEYRSCAALAAGMLAVVGAASFANSLAPWAAALAKLLVFPAFAAAVVASGMVRRHEWSKLLGLSARFAPGLISARLRRLSDSLASSD